MEPTTLTPETIAQMARTLANYQQHLATIDPEALETTEDFVYSLLTSAGVSSDSIGALIEATSEILDREA
jgi:hypothetical protein